MMCPLSRNNLVRVDTITRTQSKHTIYYRRTNTRPHRRTTAVLWKSRGTCIEQRRRYWFRRRVVLQRYWRSRRRRISRRRRGRGRKRRRRRKRIWKKKRRVLSNTKMERRGRWRFSKRTARLPNKREWWYRRPGRWHMERQRRWGRRYRQRGPWPIWK